jgi:putative ABC transport system ATP-binding protein
MSDRANHRPSKLSGGQQQRVAVARGLGHEPPLLLADEPTANLDHIQAEAIIRLLRELRSQGRTIVVSTHDARLVPVADRIVQMVPVAAPTPHSPTQVTLPAGASLFEQGDPSDLVYLIDVGEIDVVRILADGGEEHVARLGSRAVHRRARSADGLPPVGIRTGGHRGDADATQPDEFRERFLHRR